MNEKLIQHLGGFENMYPKNLDTKFPRIVEKIVSLWGGPELDEYFSSLLIDDRGNRQGFPPEIAHEIFLLANVYDKIQGRGSEEGSAWDNETETAKHEVEQPQLKFVPSSMLKAAESHDPTQIALYLKAGMPVDVRDERGWTPLMVASFNGNEAVAQVLILHGADIKACDHGGYTPLHWAAHNGYQNVVRLFISKGVNRNVQSNYGWTPLLQAAARGHLEIVSDLLKAGAYPDLSSRDGWTPLHKAVANNHKEIVATLLEHGASILAEHDDGSTPLSLAQKSKHQEILDLVQTKLTNAN